MLYVDFRKNKLLNKKQSLKKHQGLVKNNTQKTLRRATKPDVHASNQHQPDINL